MTWAKVEETESKAGSFASAPVHDSWSGSTTRRSSTKTIKLVTWRCSGCRKLAVTAGEDPGKCMFRSCPCFGG